MLPDIVLRRIKPFLFTIYSNTILDKRFIAMHTK